MDANAWETTVWFANQTEDKESLRRHKVSDHQYKEFPCQLCDYKALTGNHLKRHDETIHKEITYECTKCFNRMRV